MINEQVWLELSEVLTASKATLVAVSKKQSVAAIEALYKLGQRDFGENYVQEAVEKAAQLPDDIRWHFIGHLQSNKVKYIVPFVHLIQGVESFKLLQEINRQGVKNNRVINVLLQVYIADEATKFGLDEKEVIELMDYYTAQKEQLANVKICGVMGMATATDDEQQLREEFGRLYAVFQNLRQSYFLADGSFKECSMGMSGDYQIALAAGSTMVRIGSLLFGTRV